MLLKIKKKNIYLLLVFVIVASLFYLFPIIHWTNNFFSGLFYPFLFVQNKITLQTKDTFTSKREILKKYKELSESFENLLEENIKLKSITDFYTQTEELLEFKEKYSYKNAKLVQVIFKNFDSGNHYFYVDKGSSSGIKEDMVAVYKNNLIGRVSKVYPFFSKVSLISDHACQVAVYCSETKTLGIFQGKNNINEASLNHVSHLTEIKPDEYIFSSGEGLIYPRGFVLGQISSVEKSDVNQIITVKMLVDLDSVNFIYLITK